MLQLLGILNGREVGLCAVVMALELKCIFKNIFPIISNYISLECLKRATCQLQSCQKMSLCTFPTYLDVGYGPKPKSKYTEVRDITGRISLCFWLKLIIMFRDNNDKPEWTLNRLGREKQLSVFFLSYDNVSQICPLPHLRVMIFNTGYRVKVPKIYLAKSSSYVLEPSWWETEWPLLLTVIFNFVFL